MLFEVLFLYMLCLYDDVYLVVVMCICTMLYKGSKVLDETGLLLIPLQIYMLKVIVFQQMIFD